MTLKPKPAPGFTGPLISILGLIIAATGAYMMFAQGQDVGLIFMGTGSIVAASGLLIARSFKDSGKASR